MSASRFRICAWIDTSSEATASSSRSTRGSAASARAIATRWRWPPESAPGTALSWRSSRPTWSPSSATRAARSPAVRSKCRRRTSSMHDAGVWRGSSELYGSWNTIWVSRPRRRRSDARRAGELRSAPATAMRPEVGVSRPTSIRASVVLPEPDSPTTASDSRSATAKLTSSTATISSPRAAPRTRNTLRSRSTSRTALPTRTRLLADRPQVDVHVLGPPTAHEARTQRPQHLLLRRALRLAIRAAVGERASLRRLEGGPGPSGDRGQALGGGVEPRPGGQKGGGVGVEGVGVQAGARLLLDDRAGVHDAGAVADGAGQLEIVGDEEHGQAALAAQVVEDRHHLRLGGDVESGRRLVGEQQLRLRQQRGGDHHPLQQPAGELVRELAQAPGTVLDADLGQGRHRPPLGLVLADALRRPQRLGEEVADAAHRVRVRARILEDHRDPIGAVAAQLARAELEHLAAAEGDPAVDDGARRQQPRDGPRGHRLARAGLAHQADRLARPDLQRHVVDHRPQHAVDRELDVQARDVEQRVGRGGHSAHEQTAAPSLRGSDAASNEPLPAGTIACACPAASLSRGIMAGSTPARANASRAAAKSSSTATSRPPTSRSPTIMRGAETAVTTSAPACRRSSIWAWIWAWARPPIVPATQVGRPSVVPISGISVCR